MKGQVTIVAFARAPWPGQNVVDNLRVQDKIRVRRPDSGKNLVVAETAFEDRSPNHAAKDLYWSLRKKAVITRQSSGFLTVYVVDERGQRHLPSMEAILAAGRWKRKPSRPK